MEEEIQQEDNNQIEYVSHLGGVSRFECPANVEYHSKFLNSYEMYKYHIKFCRELRDLPEISLCKFCTKLFVESSKRDQHQVNCSCRLVQDNVVFEMPQHLSLKYPQNTITFENQEEFYEIVACFPDQEPLSINIIEGRGVKSEQEIDTEDQHKVDKSCCDHSHFAQSEEPLDETDEDISDYPDNLMQEEDERKQDSQEASQLNFSILNQQIEILSFQEQLIQPANKSFIEDDSDFKKPSRKKYSARKFKNIVKKSTSRPIRVVPQQPQILRQQFSSELIVIEDEETQPQNNSPTLSKQIEQSQKILQAQALLINDPLQDFQFPFTNPKMINNPLPSPSSIMKFSNNEFSHKKPSKSSSEFQLENPFLESADKKSSNQQNIKSFEYYDRSEGNSRRVEPDKPRQRMIEIKVMDVMKDKNLFLQEEENFIQDYNYLHFFSKKNFQKFNSYLIKNISNNIPEEHLVASFSVTRMEDIDYLQENFMKNPKDSQFCLMQIEIGKLFNQFTQKQPYTCTFLHDIEPNEHSYKSDYSIFILTLENSQILDKEFIPQPPQNAFDITDDLMKPIQLQELQQKKLLTKGQNENNQHSQQTQNVSNNILYSVKLNLYVYEGFQVLNYDLKLHQVYLAEKLTKDLLETTAIDLKIWERVRSQTEKQLYQYSSDIEYYNKLKNEKDQQLLELKDKMEQDDRTTRTKKKIRFGKEKQLEEQIQKKTSEKENNLFKYDQTQKDIVDLKNQVAQLQQSLLQEIEKEFKSAKDKSDVIYNQQVEKHKSEVLAFASENITDQLNIIEHLKSENEQMLKEQYDLMDVQRKQGSILLKYDQKYENLLIVRRTKEKQIQFQKNKSQTSYLCIVCKKYPQSCLQKPCGHIVCCYTCLNAENEEKEIIFCKICSVEIIKFSEIKYKILR